MKQSQTLKDENVKIAELFLGWMPPVTIDQLPLLRDSDLRFAKACDAELLSKWRCDGSLFVLPTFRENSNSTTHLVKRFRVLDLFIEIEAFGNDYIATVYAEERCEKIVASGRSATRPDAMVNAVIDYVDNYLPRMEKC